MVFSPQASASSHVLIGTVENKDSGYPFIGFFCFVFFFRPLALLETGLSLFYSGMLGIVVGEFRRLWSGDREITVISADRWSASGRFGRSEVQAILADHGGWVELRGASWITGVWRADGENPLVIDVRS